MLNLVGMAGMAVCLRVNLMKTLDETLQQVAVGRDLFRCRLVVRYVISACSFAIGQRVIEGDVVSGVELAVEAVAVAQPPLVA